jgi:hypothetical protein
MMVRPVHGAFLAARIRTRKPSPPLCPVTADVGHCTTYGKEEHMHYGTCVLHTAGGIEGGREGKLVLEYAIAGCGRAGVVALQGSPMVATINVRMILVLIVR